VNTACPSSRQRVPNRRLNQTFDLEVVGFETNPPAKSGLTFAQAREAWLRRWQAERRLTHADRALVTQVYLHFNRLHFESTGELLAWQGWKTIATRAGLSEASIFRGLRKLERLSALEIIHRGRDPKTGWRLPNEYLAINSPPFAMKGGHLSNGKEATLQDESRLAEAIDSLSQEDSLKIERDSRGGPSAPKKENRKPREGSKPTEDSNPLPLNSSSEGFPPSNSSSAPKGPPPPGSARPPSPRPRHDRWNDRCRREEAEAEAALERYRAAALAANGGGS